MIKFFRKIRQRLLTENRFSKYLIYAIGEIILVVVGILIALQINNWNQNQQNQTKEDLILNTLKSEFDENIKRYSETSEYQLDVLVNSRKLLNCLEKKDQNFKRDSIVYFIVNGALNYYRAEPILGTYQALAGDDLNLIENELLKSKLASFAAEVNQGFEDETASMNILNQLHLEFSSTIQILMPKELKQYYGVEQPKDSSLKDKNDALLKMYQNPRIFSLVMWKGIFEENRLALQYKMSGYSNEILALIEAELRAEK